MVDAYGQRDTVEILERLKQLELMVKVLMDERQAKYVAEAAAKSAEFEKAEKKEAKTKTTKSNDAETASVTESKTDNEVVDIISNIKKSAKESDDKTEE